MDDNLIIQTLQNWVQSSIAELLKWSLIYEHCLKTPMVYQSVEVTHK